MKFSLFKIIFGFFLFISTLSMVSEVAHAGYEGDVIRRNDFGYFEFEIVPQKPFIIENPCNPIYSIQIVFKNSEHTGKKMKLTVQQLDINPTQVDVPGMEYTFCYFNLVSEVFNEENPDASEYILTFDYKVDKNWIDQNSIDDGSITTYIFENDDWEENETSLVTTSTDEMRFITTLEENKPNFAIAISGFPEHSDLYETGVSSWWYIVVAFVFALLIEFLPEKFFAKFTKK